MEEDSLTGDFDSDNSLDECNLEDGPAVISCPVCQLPNAFDAQNPIVAMSTCAFLKELADRGSPGTGIGNPPPAPPTPPPVARVLQDEFESLANNLSETFSKRQSKSPVSRVRRADHQDGFGIRRKKQRMAAPLRSPFAQDPSLRSPFISPIATASTTHLCSPFHDPTAYATSTSSLAATLSSLSMHP